MSRPRHIALNAHLLSVSNSYRSAGIHRYIDALLSHLPAVTDHRVTAFVGDPNARAANWPGIAMQPAGFATASPIRRVLWEQFAQPAHLHRQQVDLVHGPAYALPLVCPACSVVTVHDLSFFTYPHTLNRTNRTYLKLLTRLSVRQADAVIAVSNHTRRELIELLDVPAARIRVVPNGVDDRFRPLPRSEIDAFRARRGIPQHFVFCQSTIEPRKNLTTLLRAFAALPQIKHVLVIGGGRGWQYEAIFAMVEQFELADRVWFPGFIPDEELPLWHNAADVFVFPSLYEGFGLPPLEAMACGTPVIASDSSSLPEVVGDSGLLIDVADVAALQSAITQLLHDQVSAASLAARGLARARQFSWRETARQTAAIYDIALGIGESQRIADAISR
jgi:glycosyltransferase involved in cell wall biosynthesis